MFETLSRRALATAVALLFVAGCAGGSAPVGAPDSFSGQTARAVRVLPGPRVAGPVVVPLVPQRSHVPHVWPAAATQILFVADSSNSQVLMYDPKTPNPSPEVSITDGIDAPAQLAIDKTGALYVSNLGNSTITVYPKGATSPSLTITSGLSSNYGVAVDRNGNVFASNLGTNTVTGYMAGQTSPYQTITSPCGGGQPVGLATDRRNDVYVACDSNSSVYVIPAGSSTAENSGLTGLNGPVGLAFGRRNVLYVANFGGSDVTIYKKGSLSPSGTITTGIETNGPTLDGFTHGDAFFQSNQDDDVVGYEKGQTSPFSTITGIGNPLGIASWPEVKK